MNKLTISFETPHGVHTFTVNEGDNRLYDVAVDAIERERQTPTGERCMVGSETIARITKAVLQYPETSLRETVVADRVEAMAKRVAEIPQQPAMPGTIAPYEGGPYARITVANWNRIRRAVDERYPAPTQVGRTVQEYVDIIIDAVRNHG